MGLQYTPASIPLLISIIISLVLVFTAFGRRHVPGARSFIWLMLGVTEWTIFYTLEISSVDPQLQMIWIKFRFIGIAIVPISWLAFALEYNRLSNWLTKRNVLLAAIVPAAIIITIWTNDFHHLFWSATIIHASDGIPYVEYVNGTAFWVHAAYSYIFLIVGSFLLIRQSLRGPSLFETQAAMMMLGAAVPFLANLVYVFWLGSVLRLDPTPFAMMLSGVFYAWGLFRLGLFDLLPVAGEVVLEGLQDGVMVLDHNGRVVYINPAFVDYSGISERDAIGSTARQVLARWPELVDEYRDTIQTNTQIAVQLAGDAKHQFELRIAPLMDRQRRLVGRAFILREMASPGGTRELDLTSATARRNLMLMTTKANGEVVAVNDRFVGVLGYARPDIIEKASINIWESGEQRSTLLRTGRNEGFENKEISLVAKDGHKVDLIASAKSISVHEETYLFFAMREKRSATGE